jgi:hypothetical protein
VDYKGIGIKFAGQNQDRFPGRTKFFACIKAKANHTPNTTIQTMSDLTPQTTNKFADTPTSPRPRIGSTSSLKRDDEVVLSPSDYYSDDDSGVVEEETPRQRVPTRHDGSFDLCGSMWKRRGGLGRNAENKW